MKSVPAKNFFVSFVLALMLVGCEATLPPSKEGPFIPNEQSIKKSTGTFSEYGSAVRRLQYLEQQRVTLLMKEAAHASKTLPLISPSTSTAPSASTPTSGGAIGETKRGAPGLQPATIPTLPQPAPTSLPRLTASDEESTHQQLEAVEKQIAEQIEEISKYKKTRSVESFTGMNALKSGVAAENHPQGEETRSSTLPDALMPHPLQPAKPQPPEIVKAGSHDDNEEFSYYQKYLEKISAVYGEPKTDLSKRTIFKIIDDKQLPVPFATVKISKGKFFWQGNSYPNGESLYFPGVSSSAISSLQNASVIVSYKEISYSFVLKESKDGIQEFKLPVERALKSPLPVDIVFLMDTTGSMQDEIDGLKDAIFSIHSRLIHSNEKIDLRFGLVQYRDRGDKYLVQSLKFTSDIDGFQKVLNEVQASGGGDYPEDLQRGLKEAVDNMDWRNDAIKSIFLLADAPPHMDYPDEENYLSLMRKANQRNIKICSIGASGLDPIGEYIFRQMSVYTYGQFIFLTYGESGESEGKGDPGKVSHHTGSNYSIRNLNDLVVDVIKQDIAYLIPPAKVQRVARKTVEETEHIEIRVDNILDQLRRQILPLSPTPVTAAIVPFETEEDDLKELAEYLRDVSSENILKEKWLRLVERKHLDQLLKEQGLSLTGSQEPKTAAELGKILGAKFLLFGKLYYLGVDRVLYLQAVATETAQIVAAARVRI